MVVAYHTAQAHDGAWPNGAAGVDLFFVISGFVMVTSSRGLEARPDPARIFVARRLRRIVPLYWLLTAAKLAVALAAPTATPHTAPSLWNLAASLLFVPSRDAAGAIRPVLPVGWTLEFEMLFYALFALTLCFRVRPLWITPALAILAAAGFWRTGAWPAPFILANGMVLEFAAGMAIAAWWQAPRPREGRTQAPRDLAWIAASVAAAALLLASPSCGAWRFLFWGWPAAMIVAGAITYEARLCPLLPRLLTLVGDASFAIYLVHPFIVGALAGRGLTGALFAIPASVVGGMALHRWVDAPLQRAFRGRNGAALPQTG